tara:strand:- start:69 stop:635 length:567 start_codon:yes stop_codon:yes gene_type:complete
MIKNKQCITCYRTKPLSEFAKRTDYNPEKYRPLCKECRSEQSANWQKKNIERAREIARNFAEKVRNGERPHRREAMRLRATNRGVIKKIASSLKLGKQVSFKEDIFFKNFGCSSKVFIRRFERYFEKNPGMTWHNHGAWHMDHVKPLKEFELDTEANRKLANHYTNLRPEWGLNNLQKGAKYEMEQTI